jgi:RNA polymerase sigma-70 factor, ECF subfamily
LPVSPEQDARWSSGMAAAQSGDAAAYDALLRDILPFLRTLARRERVSPEQVEDVVQDTLLTIHRVRHTYDPTRPFVPWLVAIAKRRSIDARRRSGRIGAWEKAAPELLETFEDQAANKQAELDEMREWLQRALRNLPYKQRDAINLVKSRGLSVSEAAKLTGQSAGAIKVNIHRALRTLRAFFQER